MTQMINWLPLLIYDSANAFSTLNDYNLLYVTWWYRCSHVDEDEMETETRMLEFVFMC